MPDSRHYAGRAYEHIRQLAEVIGPRPSTGLGERAAADYAAKVMRRTGLRDVWLEPFEAPRSTYAPYRRAFAAALLGTALGRLLPGRVGALLAAALCGLGAQGFAAEADLAHNWTRRLVSWGDSHNVIGVVPASARMRQRVVIYGHLDTHRTPIFYSSPAWLRVFSPLIGLSFASLGLNALIYAARALRPTTVQREQRTKNKEQRARRHASRITHHASRNGILNSQFSILNLFQLLTSSLQLSILALLAHADTTPYAPGANDNASGTATALALGERLASQPLRHTEVWVVATGCEELGAYGMAALLDRHAELLRDALFLDFDMVGIGQPAAIAEQGLLRRRRADARLLGAARHIATTHPGLGAWEHSIDAYDDSSMVARRGFRGITIDAEGRPGSAAAAEHKHWHQLSDTLDKIDRESLRRVHEFAWHLLQHLDN